MKIRRSVWLLGLIFGLLLIFGMAPTALSGTIKIGVAAPFTGGAAAYGDNVYAGLSLKLKEINDAGGINGDKIKLVKGDDLCEPKDAGNVASKFAADKSIVAVIGHLCSSATLAGMPIYVRAKTPVISATSTNSTIGKEAGKGWFFRNVYADDYQGAFLASYVQKVLGLKRIGVFYDNNDYGIGLKETFVKEAERLGIKIIGTEGYVAKTTDFSPQLTKLKAGKPDGIFICGYYQEGGLIAGQARKLGLNIPLFGADGLDNEDYIKIAGKAADGTYCTVPFLAAVAGPEAKGVVDAFKAKTGRDMDWMAANAYDCLGMLAEVIAKVGADRQKIRDGLATYNSPKKAYDGLTGPTYFDKNGDTTKTAAVKMVKDGKFVPAKQMQ
jgi:branched-chain amino acid transport system substrate-binding protein